jgi:hypothetical protein
VATTDAPAVTVKDIATRPMFWVISVLVVFVIYKAPHDASDILRALGDSIVALIRGIGIFLNKLGSG